MSKILVFHPDAAELPSLAAKVNALHKKSGPFDVVIMIGDCLPERRSALDDVHFEVPVFFTLGAKKVEYVGDDVEDLAPNMSYMGKYGLFTTAADTTVAFITGSEGVLKDKLPEILDNLEGKSVDVLVTYQWPYVLATEKELFFGNTNIDTIVEKVQPKYHFATGSSAVKFFEREPFQWSDSSNVTRFISLGKYGSGDKWVYAFNLNKSSSQGIPKNLTSNPFAEFRRKQEEKVSKQAETLITKRVHGSEQIQPRPKKAKAVVLPENCFFCLSNPKLESHMIISIGDHAYLTIAKGPLTRPTSTMKVSGHCLIIPIAHISSLQPTKEHPSVVISPLYNEILRYESSLVKFFNSFNLSVVFFQINRSESVHFHIQCFPIADDFLVDFEKVLNKTKDINNIKYTRSAKLEFQKFESTESEKYIERLNSKKDYISFTIFHGSVVKQETFLSDIPEGEIVDLQFGRRVMAHLLQTPKRLKWDKCQQGRTVEEHETETFKELFKPYDFTLDL